MILYHFTSPDHLPWREVRDMRTGLAIPADTGLKVNP